MEAKRFLYRDKNNIMAYLYISPFYILYAIFGIYPILFSAVMSFSNYSTTKGFNKYVGLKNYATVFSDPIFWRALWNTLWFVVFNIPFLLFCALVVAAILNNNNVKGRKFFQLSLLLPYVTSSIAYTIVFAILFDTHFGLINGFLGKFGIVPIPWLTSPDWTKITINLVLIWAWTGYNMLIVLGGIQNIGQELYEAAIVDGASSLVCFLKITIPLLRPVIYFILITSTIGTFGIFNEPYIFVGGMGGADNAAITLNLYLYNQSFYNMRLPVGAATSFVIFFIIFIFSLPQIRRAFRDS